MAVKEVTAVATNAATEAVAATAKITEQFAGGLDNFLAKGLETKVSTGFEIQGRACRATLILEILHAVEPKVTQ